MKVLHVAETLKGGLETYLRIVSNFQRNSPEISQVKFILPGQVDWLSPESAHVVPTARSPLSLVGYAKRVKKIIESERPSVLHLHSSIAGGIVRSMALLGQIPREVKIVYCSHGWAFDQAASRYKKSAYRWIERLLSSRSDAIICISRHEVRIAAESGIRRCTCIPNGIDAVSTDAAMSHLAKLISSPYSLAIWMPIGLADVAVIHNADDTARLAMPQNMR